MDHAVISTVSTCLGQARPLNNQAKKSFFATNSALISTTTSG